MVAVLDTTTLENVLVEAGKKLEVNAKMLYNPIGAILDDIDLIKLAYLCILKNK